jgi:hypothetical protein
LKSDEPCMSTITASRYRARASRPEITNRRLHCLDHAPARLMAPCQCVQFKISDFGLAMQDSSDFKISISGQCPRKLWQ